MTTTDFKRLSSFIHKECGIKMPAEKKIMLEYRLKRRLSILKIASYGEYCDFLFSKEGMQNELVHMIDAVTTNKTDFFRESPHFDFLTQYALPELCNGSGADKELKIWSAACSSGEEVYTLATVINEYVEMTGNVKYHILGTDISTRILAASIAAVYAEDRITGIPAILKRKYFMKSKDRTNKTVRVVPEIRGKTHFKRVNLMDDNYDVRNDYDIIFCRNVLIYFDRVTQESVINKLSTKLKPGGFLFLGHSESVSNMQIPLTQVRPTILKKISNQ